MKRILFVTSILLLLAAVMLMPRLANAQVCPPWVDPIICQQEDTRDILRNNRRQHESTLVASRLERLIFRGGYYGYYDNGIFNPVYDRNRRPIGRREATITGAAIGAAIGSAVTGNWRGTAAGAGGGAIVGMLLGGRSQDDDRSVDCSKRKLNRREQETCSVIAAEQQAAFAQEQAQAELAERQRTAARFYNNTGFSVDVFDGNQFVVNLRRGQTINLPEAYDGYRAEMLVPDRSVPGRTVRVEADFRLANDRSGWVFTAPSGGGV